MWGGAEGAHLLRHIMSAELDGDWAGVVAAAAVVRAVAADADSGASMAAAAAAAAAAACFSFLDLERVICGGV